jgi:hypothetical protein
MIRTPPGDQEHLFEAFKKKEAGCSESSLIFKIFISPDNFFAGSFLSKIRAGIPAVNAAEFTKHIFFLVVNRIDRIRTLVAGTYQENRFPVIGILQDLGMRIFFFKRRNQFFDPLRVAILCLFGLVAIAHDDYCDQEANKKYIFHQRLSLLHTKNSFPHTLITRKPAGRSGFGIFACFANLLVFTAKAQSIK